MVFYKTQIGKIEDTYRDIFNEMNDSIFIQDIETGKILDVNKKMCSVFGYSPDEIIKQNVNIISSGEPEFSLKKAREWQKKVATGEPQQFEWKCRNKFGHLFWTEVNLKQITVQDRKFTLAVVRDISDHKETEQRLKNYQKKLRSLASQLTLTEERARRYLATNIHDTIGHSLAVINNRIEALRDTVSSNNITEKLNQIQDNLLQTIQNTRSVILEISPPIIYELGLVAAISWSIEQFREQEGINIKLIKDGNSLQLKDDISILLFRAVRELLINITKHAKAKNVKVIIQVKGKHIYISVEDDGIGFIHDRKIFNDNSHKGFGLFSITERLNYLGGKLHIKSEPGQGTKISLIAPLRLTQLKEQK